MNIPYAHTVLAQRGPGDEWTNLLFVIVMAVLWLAGGIIKAMKTKAENQQQTRQPPARKPSDSGRAVRQQRQQASTQRPQRPAGPPRTARPEQAPGAARKPSKLEELREAARRFAAEAEQAFKEQAPKPKPTPRPAKQTKPSQRPQVYQEAKAEIKPVGSPILQRAEKGKRQDIFAQEPASEKLSDLVSDYADPEKLRKAILHYEILGPPVSLRD